MRTHDIINLSAKVEALKPSTKLTINTIVKQHLLPWAKDERTVKKIIRADLHGPNILKADTGDIKSVYIVEARNLNRYIKAYGPAFMYKYDKDYYKESKGGK